MEKEVKIETKYKWIPGDWVFNEFELKQVITVNDEGFATNLDDGYSSLATKTSKSFPVTLATKRITDAFKLFYDRLMKDEGISSRLNWPEIHKYLCQQFDKSCIASEFNDDHTDEDHVCARKFVDEAEVFVGKVFESLNAVDSITVAGIKILK